jgi:hypothetical protein
MACSGTALALVSIFLSGISYFTDYIARANCIKKGLMFFAVFSLLFSWIHMKKGKALLIVKVCV